MIHDDFLCFNSNDRKIAWQQAGDTYTYADLEHMVSERVAVSNFSQAPFGPMLLPSTRDLAAAIDYLAAWRSHGCVCVIPSDWPLCWQSEIREIIHLGWPKLGSMQNKIFYLLPTSGSTGRPKLVAVTRSNFSALIEGLLPRFQWHEQDRVAQTFQSAFDPFVAMIFLALSQHTTVVQIPEAELFDPLEFCQREKISIWASVPSLPQLTWARRKHLHLPNLRQSLFTGETLKPSFAAEWFKLNVHQDIHNLYGPVETTVWVTHHIINTAELMAQPRSVSIGQALPNVEMQSIDDELVVSGAQVAAGYLTREGLTAFNGIYRTGDLGYWSDESWHLQGRRDGQIKHLGQRIETEALENEVFAELGLGVLVWHDDASGLVLAYEGTIDLAQVQSLLREKFPKSHWPREFWGCASFKRTATGKVDRNAIRKLQLGQQRLQNQFEVTS